MTLYDLEDSSGNLIDSVSWGGVVRLARALTLTDGTTALRVVARGSDAEPRRYRLDEVLRRGR